MCTVHIARGVMTRHTHCQSATSPLHTDSQKHRTHTQHTHLDTHDVLLMFVPCECRYWLLMRDEDRETGLHDQKTPRQEIMRERGRERERGETHLRMMSFAYFFTCLSAA